MVELIVGGSGSGKSEYAEKEALRLSRESNRLIYLATMENSGSEASKRIKKHRENRDGKGFFTVELPRNVGELKEKMPASEKAANPGECTVLLEALSVLLANEMFSKEPEMPSGGYGSSTAPESERVGERILHDIEKLISSVKHLVIVSDDVFREGGRLQPETESAPDNESDDKEKGLKYPDITEEYLKELGFLHRRIAEISDRVVEVAAGNEVLWKK